MRTDALFKTPDCARCVRIDKNLGCRGSISAHLKMQKLPAASLEYTMICRSHILALIWLQLCNIRSINFSASVTVVIKRNEFLFVFIHDQRKTFLLCHPTLLLAGTSSEPLGKTGPVYPHICPKQWCSPVERRYSMHAARKPQMLQKKVPQCIVHHSCTFTYSSPRT